MFKRWSFKFGPHNLVPGFVRHLEGERQILKKIFLKITLKRDWKIVYR